MLTSTQFREIESNMAYPDMFVQLATTHFIAGFKSLEQLWYTVHEAEELW